MKLRFLILVPVLGLSACTSVASLAASTATNLSSSTPQQVTTLGDANLAADTIVVLTKTAVDTGVFDKDPATLTEIQALRAGLRAALDQLNADSAAGHSLNFSTFNSALNAYNAYLTVKGIKH